jgi:lipoate-protein ligase B
METKSDQKSKNLRLGFTDANSTEILHSEPTKDDGSLTARNLLSPTRNAKRETGFPKPEAHNPNPTTRNKQPTTSNTQHTTNIIKCYAVDLGVMDYYEAWNLQSDIVSARVNGTIDTDIILFLEHPAVFTLGRRGGLDHLLVSEKFLQTSGISIVHVERGGNITFHGPGQLVAYPIVNLKARSIGVVDFVEALEDVMLATVRTWGIAAERNPANRGIWGGNSKMGSIGLAIRKSISFHGLALNVNVDLTPFSWIQPCGLQGVCMTSMKQELGRELSMDEVCAALKKQFESVLGLNLTTASYSHLQYQLQNPG